MRLVDELAKARGEKTEKEKLLEEKEKELEREFKFREAVQIEFENAKQACREANNLKYRELDVCNTRDYKILDKVAHLLMEEGVVVVKMQSFDIKHMFQLYTYKPYWLHVSW